MTLVYFNGRKEKPRELSKIIGVCSIIETDVTAVSFPEGSVCMSFFWNRFSSLPAQPDQFVSPPAFFYHLPVLETEDLVLRKPQRKDVKDVFLYASDQQVARYVLWEPHRSPADTRLFLRDLRSRIRSGYPSSWVVVLRDTGHVIGTIGFVWYSTDNCSAELGYSFSREYWNHGYATQALKAVIDTVFRYLPLNRLEAQHDVRNPASGRVMQKCGLLQEGILRGRILNKGEYVDTALYAILRSDWEISQR